MTSHPNDQYMLVAKPISDIKAIINGQRTITEKAAGRRRYRHAIMYALAELKIPAADSAYRTGWNAAIEAAVDLVRKTD